MTTHPITTTPLSMRWRGFNLTIADKDSEREMAWRIRHDVFLKEMLGRPRPDGMERDSFDDHYDQVLVTSATGEAVGTCRVISTAATERFYSASEFAIAPFLAQPGVKIELGRVCLCPAWRNNLALAAMGRAIGWYARSHQASWIFGCTSIATVDPLMATALTRHFANTGAYTEGFGILPLPAFRLPHLAQSREGAAPAVDQGTLERLIPPLLRFYLRAGASLGCEPALDQNFSCLDFFTIVNLEAHRHSVLGRYVPC